MTLLLRQQIGCAVMSSPGTLEGAGFAAIDGKAAEAFASVDELPERHPGVVWVTSVLPAAFLRGHGQRKPWLRSARFLATSVPDVLAELGVAMMSASRTAQLLSEVLSRVLALGEQLCTFEFPGLPQHGFAELLRQGLAPEASPPSGLAGVEEALQQYLSAPPFRARAATGEDLRVSLALPRVAHYEAVTGELVPSGAWHEINLVAEASPYAWVRDSSVPVLALVTIANPRPGLAGLLSGAIARGARTWVPHPELRMLGNYADVTVCKAYFADEYLALAATLARPCPKMGPVDHAAISSGLLAEAFRCAISSTAPECAGGLSRPAWVLSAARGRVLAEAAALACAGFRVLSYDSGQVTIAAKRQELTHLCHFVAESAVLVLPSGLATSRTGVPSCS